MKHMVAFTFKFWVSLIPISIMGLLIIFLTQLISIFSSILAFVFFVCVFIFGVLFLWEFFMTCVDSVWRDLYQTSVKKNWNKNIQTFLKFLWEN